jgi:hypothetical protein
MNRNVLVGSTLPAIFIFAGCGHLIFLNAKPISFDPCPSPVVIVEAPGDLDCNTATFSKRNASADAWYPVPVPQGAGEVTRRSGPKGARYCVFATRDGASPSDEALRAMGGSRDCPASGMMAGTTAGAAPTDLWKDLAESADRQALGVKDLASGEPWRGRFPASPDSVRVAVVDATPLPLDQPDNSLHGFAVSRVIGNIACDSLDDPRCKSLIVPYLALPLVPGPKGKNVPDLARGGFFGYLYQLADAIDQALTAWNPSQHKHLVINLSLGWDPIKFLPTDAGVKMVLGQLERASCMGALVITAAGNITGTEGPLLPAGYEGTREPSRLRCEQMGIPAPTHWSVATDDRYRPLVYAVGALDASHQRLPIMRHWGQPRLSAHGMAVPIPGKASPGSMVFTGTSMAAAVVSGVATVAWGQKPGADAHEIMKLVYDSTTPLDGGHQSNRARTDFCNNEPEGPCITWPVHRVSLCGVLKKGLGLGVSCEDARPDPQPAFSMGAGPSIPATSKIGAPCGISNCGQFVGPLSIQIPRGAVPQPGLGQCATCQLLVNASGTATLSGTPASVPPQPASYAFVRTWDEYWRAQDYSVPMPQAAGIEYSTSLAVPPGTRAATLNWSYQVAGGWATDVDSLIIKH